jgi:hypothetical protein
MIGTTILEPAPSIVPTNFFGEPTLIGLKVEMAAGKPCCGCTLAELHSGKGPHVYELRCTSCGRHRGWLSKATAQ